MRLIQRLCRFFLPDADLPELFPPGLVVPGGVPDSILDSLREHVMAGNASPDGKSDPAGANVPATDLARRRRVSSSKV
ncbi:hypothetical protein [Paraburkholderia sartisoli]|uniref:Uncharacterized protein n=1 Tax=Paraburkholderia sartisoli TaxID=83784 RepID=A0A1H4CWS2_9BURK|nr:hypothetical protein [Paraburkholderia sartisoli]SEA64729.1 hypothetical protein SAMN05192564_102529 [Paraburkholderia sartisoli]